MTRKEEITKKIEQLEIDLYKVDKKYEICSNLVGTYLEKKIKLNEQINDLKEELQEIESENLIAPLNSAITTLKNYCSNRPCECCLLKDNCKRGIHLWNKVK